MTRNFTFFDKTFQQDIYQGMVDAEESGELSSVLVQMQIDAGVDRQAAEKNAQLCIKAVASCESVREEVESDAKTVVKSLLEDIENCSHREQALHELYFGLTVYQDAENVRKIQNGISAEELFWRYYNANHEKKSVEELEADIYSALENYQLSAELLQTLANKMEKSGEYLATAAAIGEGGFAFKSVAAMELYLENPAMTIHEAANMACAGVEMQAVADAVGGGMMDRSVAKKLLIAIGLAAAVIGLGIVIYHAGTAVALSHAAAAVTDMVVELPAIFEPFATATTASGAPATVISTAETIRRTVFDPLAAAARNWQIAGSMAVTVGTSLMMTSEKTADLIGKFRVGFAKGNKAVKSGLTQMADYIDETQKESEPLYHWEDAKPLKASQPIEMSVQGY